jgi:hypothetical protein
VDLTIFFNQFLIVKAFMMPIFKSPRKRFKFYKNPSAQPNVPIEQPCDELNNAIEKRVRDMSAVLDAASESELLLIYKQSPLVTVGLREPALITDQQVVKYAQEIKAITGKWLMPDDVKDEVKHRKHDGLTDLTHAEVAKLTHFIVVTGRKGCFSPADITSSSHWISQNSLRTRPMNEKTVSFQTRVAFNKVGYFSCHHATFAAFKSRAAIKTVFRPRVNGKSVLDGKSLLHCSYLCHVDPDEERRLYYKQPRFKAGGKCDLKHVKFFSDVQIFKKIIEILAITGKWMMKSDVEDEVKFHRLNKIANLTWGELVEITHLLLVVGRRRI